MAKRSGLLTRSFEGEYCILDSEHHPHESDGSVFAVFYILIR